MTIGRSARKYFALALALAATIPTIFSPDAQAAYQAEATPFAVSSDLLDLSGMAWIQGDDFLAVHDAKNGDENDRPRVSVVRLPESPIGITWEPFDIDWPDEDPSNDLESVARIPGTNRFLLVESGDDGQEEFRRIFLTTVTGNASSYAITIDAVVEWPEPVFNVEGTAVTEVKGEYMFIYAERAESEPTTEIRWASLSVGDDDLKFGQFESAVFKPGISGQGIRPIVGLDFDSEGHLYAVTAYDSENDNGPFSSFISRIGTMTSDQDGRFQFEASGDFGDIAKQEGFKIESVAVHESNVDALQIYAGTDDENYGATLRMVWPIDVQSARRGDYCDMLRLPMCSPLVSIGPVRAQPGLHLAQEDADNAIR